VSLNISLNISIVFPGQGSQSLGMLSALAQQYPTIKQTFEEASEVVGFDCWTLTQDGPQAQLDQTRYTQPVLLAADIAVWRLLLQEVPELKPSYLAGHSLGEYAALVAAQALTFSDAIHLVSKRGEFMQLAADSNASTGTLMAAILGLDNSVIEQSCNEIMSMEDFKNQIVSPANYNAIGQTVIAGNKAAVLAAIELMKQKGAKRAIPLPVSVPSHCVLMQAAAQQLAQLLESIEIKTPQIPVLHNKDVQFHAKPALIKQILCEQLVCPVRWVETIQQFSQNRVQAIIECGPGKVLAGLIKRIDSGLAVYNTDTPEGVNEILCLPVIP